MFIPVSCDAPLYHRPVGTMGLIAANGVTFWLTSGGDRPDGWLLTFGNGLHPSEWVASAFLHFGWTHLIFNMIFLWSFGMIIEGKLGWIKYLGLYLVLCLCDGFLGQVLMLKAETVGGPHGAGGASGVIFALMAIALVWAPANSFEVVYVFVFRMLIRSGFFDISVYAVSAFYIGINLFFAWLNGFAMSTPVLHLLGAIVGLPIGFLYLRKNWVDCENWDIISVWNGKNVHRQDDSWRSYYTGTKQSQRKASPGLTPKKLNQKIESSIAESNFLEALHWYPEYRKRASRFFPLQTTSYRGLIEWCRREEQWQEASFVLEDYIATSPSDLQRARLMLAGIYAKQLNRPKAALRSLNSIDQSQLSDHDLQLAQRITKAAQSELSRGVLEIAE